MNLSIDVALSGTNLVLLVIAVLGTLGVLFRVPLIKWEFKIRQTKKKVKDLKQLNKNQRKIIDNIRKLESFIDWLNPQFPNVKARKTFWLEFALDKKLRKEWFAKLFAENAGKVKDRINYLKNPPRPPARVVKTTQAEVLKYNKNKTEAPKAGKDETKKTEEKK